MNAGTTREKRTICLTITIFVIDQYLLVFYDIYHILEMVSVKQTKL